MEVLFDQPEVIYRLTTHTEVGGVHTFSIVRNPHDGVYYGYAGPRYSGPVDLWRSSDLHDWTRYEDNPILNEFGLRWPSVIWCDGKCFMAARKPYTDVFGGGFRQWFERQAVSNRALKTGSLALRRFESRPKTSIELFSSPDGTSFSRIETLVCPRETGLPQNQNPFIFEDANSGKVILLYYVGGNGVWEIRAKKADHPLSLVEAEDVVILKKDRVAAAPSMFYHEPSSKYILLTETVDKNPQNWVTEYHIGNKLDDSFFTPEENVLYREDQACAAPFAADASLFMFVSQRNRFGPPQYWEGELLRYEI